MAQHDFAPAWLNFPNPPSTKSLHFEKHSENFVRSEHRYDISRRRHNSSDGFDSNIGRSNGGNFGRKEKNGWRSQARNGTENITQRGGYNGACSRTHSSTFHSGKSQGLHENNVPDNETGKKPSLNPDHDRGLNHNRSLTGGVWEYPLNPRSRTSRMLVIKKGIREDLSLSGFHVVTSSHSLPVKNGTGLSVYKGFVPKPAAPPTKPTQWKSQTKESKTGTLLSQDFAHSFNSLKTPTAKNIGITQNSVKECNRSNSSSPVDKLSQPRLTKLTRMRTDKKSEFLKALKQDRVEEEHEDGNHVGHEKDDEKFDLHDSNITCHERDINRNFDENEVSQENGNALISKQIIRSSTVPQADVLSSSLEAEHRLLKEMGWQEYSENDETCAPLTEDEMREFQEISEQLQKNGLRKNGLLKNGLTFDFKFGSWKNSTFKPTIENDETETSSSDTSDDDDV
ncbi:vasculin isoform X2 [Rhinatrema bivittatum]|uniref:vasculin isoform X2 n=1 Tax=Rhinatrema bivittatum TaxID=194408 RepID=UPI00112DFAA1|nr:vasculin isoform X2 [Rhinatrema bivittatum]